MKKLTKIVAIAAVVMLLPLAMMAQTPPHPGGGGAPGPGDPPVGAPIDGGLSLLLILGAAYGAKKTVKLGK